MSDDQENKTERVQLLMAPSEVEAIDDWGFKNRIRTRAEAIRRLCQIGLQADRSMDNLIIFIEVAQGWADASARETEPDEDAEEPSDRPASLQRQFAFFTTMALLMAKTALADLKSKQDRVKSLEDLRDLMREAESNPELEEAYERIGTFMDIWDEKFPGRSFRLAPSQTGTDMPLHEYKNAASTEGVPGSPRK